MSATATIEFEKIDDELARSILSSPPFVVVDGIINFRDFGRFTVRSDTGDGVARAIKSGHLFRSGEPTRLSDAGKATLKGLGVTTIFDLRSKVEIDRYKSSTPEIEGVSVIHTPVSELDVYDPIILAQRVAAFEADEKDSFATLYSGILESGAPAFEAILKHLRDKPDEPVLLHCTAGKDRTGVFAALILLLLGADDEDIVQDYYLTSVGLQPALPFLIARFQKEAVYANNWKGTLNMASARAATMQATLQMIREKFGGPEAYIKQYTSLIDADVDRIRKNLLVPAQRNSNL